MADRFSMAACRSIITELLPTGHPTIEHAAGRLGISVRTLQRRIRERGQSFSHLVETIRWKRAQHLLSRPGAHMTDVAKALGYADPSSFSRAFRRWTGISPRDYQRACDRRRLNRS
jgi:AraC-like DNA-binding protein